MVARNKKEARVIPWLLLQHLIYLPLDIPYPPVHRSFRHIERFLYLNDGPDLYPKVKDGPFLV